MLCDYYPFGLKQKGYNSIVNGGNSLAQKYKYNGKELNEDFDINLYEMDLRSYDPATGRFNGIDPVTHFYQGTSVAFDNNPIFWADPSGADGECGNCDGGRVATISEGRYRGLAERRAIAAAGGGETVKSNLPDDFISKIKRNQNGPVVVTVRDLGETVPTGNFSYTFNEESQEYDIIMEFIVSYSQSFRVAGNNGKTIEQENMGLFRATRGHEEFGHVEQYLDAARNFVIENYDVTINGSIYTFNGTADQILTQVRSSFINSSNSIQTTFSDLVINHLDSGIRNTVNTSESDANTRAINAGISPNYLNRTTPIYWQGKKIN